MQKEEILEKARAERSDEMETFIQDRSMFWIIPAMFVCLCVFSYTRLEKDMPVEDYSATLAIAATVKNIYRFIKTRCRRYIICGIIFGAAGVLLTVLNFCKYFGV